jgi:hypothetical protein
LGQRLEEFRALAFWQSAITGKELLLVGRQLWPGPVSSQAQQIVWRHFVHAGELAERAHWWDHGPTGVIINTALPLTEPGPVEGGELSDAAQREPTFLAQAAQLRANWQ